MAPALTGDAPNRGILTLCVMLATIMQALDTTIANVALPYMQGNLSATQDQINWVLTSYIVAAAIMTPVTGFLAARLGRKRLFLIAVVGLHRRFRALRHRAVAARNGALSSRARRVRRAACADVAIGAARLLSEGEARLGDGDVGRRRHGRSDPRPDARRLAHRKLQLALGVLHQRADRHHHVSRPICVSVRDKAGPRRCRSTGSASPRSASPSARCRCFWIVASSSIGSARARSSPS